MKRPTHPDAVSLPGLLPQQEDGHAGHEAGEEAAEEALLAEVVAVLHLHAGEAAATEEAWRI